MPASRLDLPGASLLALGLVSVLLALTQGPSWGWTSAWVLGLFALGLLLFAALAAVERRRESGWSSHRSPYDGVSTYELLQRS
ncbi:hypothetical protein [Nonomuraea sp. NPDC049400]|uniref:hypothetical protein n=1 Tax=Nonomuraea sp. NPDC049400 TaxID=3364352 RepID=UPI00378924DE